MCLCIMYIYIYIVCFRSAKATTSGHSSGRRGDREGRDARLDLPVVAHGLPGLTGAGAKLKPAT